MLFRVPPQELLFSKVLHHRCHQVSDAGMGIAMAEALNKANSTPTVHTGSVQALPPKLKEQAIKAQEERRDKYEKHEEQGRNQTKQLIEQQDAR